jgi:FAD synthase
LAQFGSHHKIIINTQLTQQIIKEKKKTRRIVELIVYVFVCFSFCIKIKKQKKQPIIKKRIKNSSHLDRNLSGWIWNSQNSFFVAFVG